MGSLRIVPALRKLDSAPKISVDAFFTKTARHALDEFEVDWISDVNPQPDPHLLAMCAESRCTYVSVHTLSIPANNKHHCLPADCDPLKVLIKWGLERIDQLRNAGISSIIIDPGLGFGKTPAQSHTIMQNAKQLADALEVEIMLGHSRKGFVRSWFTLDEPSDIESVTLATQIEDFPYFLRTHTVSLHKRAFVSKMNSIVQNS
jgi:dihydropteroate synthase